MMKWLRLGVVLALGASVGWAVDWKARYPKPEGYVSDFAHVVDANSISQIEAYAAAVEQATGAQMSFVTIPSLEGEPVEDVADTIFRGWGVGEKGKDNGIMLLLSIGDRKSRLEVGYGLEPILPDGLSGSVLRDMRPALRKNDFGDAMAAAARTLGGVIAQAKNVQISVRPPQVRTPVETSDHINWGLIGGLVVLVLLLSRALRAARLWRRRRRIGVLPWLLLGNLMGGDRSSYGGRGSGGFGGPDSGDGFGGFGGGDSGGGGASSDW
ncbi:MAG: TPM domain-containing protein [Ignavibacteriota bacterium]